MAPRKREPVLRLRRWATEDWYYTNGVYRFLKSTFQQPVAWASRLQVRGVEHVPREGGALLAVNHFSWADPVILGAAIPRPAFYLAKERLFANALARRFFEGLGQIRVDRETGGNENALQNAIEALQAGLLIGVFPEGTRSRYGELKRGKTGIARLAARAGVPIVPVGMTTADFWPKHATVPSFGAKVYVAIGAPMRFDLKPQDAEDRQRMRDVTDDVMARIGELLREAQAAKERDERWT